MSRYELQELERVMREQIEDGEDSDAELSEEEDAVTYDEDGNPIDKLEVYKKTDDFINTVVEIKKLQPMRVGVFKRYWDKFKYNKKRREHMIEIFDEADEQVAFYLEGDYVNWRDSIPGVREFLKEISEKKVEKDINTAQLGNTKIRTIPGKHDMDDLQEVTYSAQTFNPFDQLNIRTQERKIRKLYIETDNIADDQS